MELQEIQTALAAGNNLAVLPGPKVYAIESLDLSRPKNSVRLLTLDSGKGYICAPDGVKAIVGKVDLQALATIRTGGRPHAGPVGDPEEAKYRSMTPEQLLLEIGGVYCSLSPENLCCDGELPKREVDRRYRDLMRKKALLERLLGRTVTETEAFDALTAESARRRSRA